jgi:hypothetical protein
MLIGRCDLLSPFVAVGVIAGWLAVIALLMASFGFVESPFFSFGPGATVVFFGNKIDTWGRWCGVTFYTVVNQIIQTYGLETISPWMITVVQNRNHQAKIEHPKRTQVAIAIWYVYLWSGRIIGIQLALSQVDFAIFILVVDVVTTAVINHGYIREKNAQPTLLDDTEPV